MRTNRFENPVQLAPDLYPDLPKKISPHLYVVYAEFPHRLSSHVIALPGNEPALIDTGSRFATDTVRERIKLLGLDLPDIKHIFLTHGHYDHIDGVHPILQVNKDVTVHYHKAERKAIEKGDYNRQAGFVYERSSPPIKAKNRNLLKDGDVFNFEGYSLDVFHTPGHTPGSVIYRINDENAKNLVVGDTIFCSGSKDTASDFELQRKSLYKIADLEFDGFVNGHNPVKEFPIPKKALIVSLPYFHRMDNPWYYLPPDEEQEGVPYIPGNDVLLLHTIAKEVYKQTGELPPNNGLYPHPDRVTRRKTHFL